MRKIDLLITSDHPVFREGLTKLLADQIDMEVIATAENTKQMMEYAKTLDPDIIVLDINKPQMNWIGEVRQIRAECPGIAIIILSEYQYPIYILKAIEVHVKGYLSKDTSLAEIKQAIKKVFFGETIYDMASAGKIIQQNYGFKGKGRKSTDPPTAQETEILKLLSQGLDIKTIAKEMGITKRTVQSLISSAYRKLNAKSRPEAVIKSLAKGWFELNEIEGEDQFN